jgi:hypothetical protein
MPAELVPENFWLLADPTQEVLVEDWPAFSQRAAVPLRQLATGTLGADLPYSPAGAQDDR